MDGLTVFLIGACSGFFFAVMILAYDSFDFDDARVEDWELFSKKEIEHG